MEEDSSTKLKLMEQKHSYMSTPPLSAPGLDTLITRAPASINPESAWYIKTGCWQQFTPLAVVFQQLEKSSHTHSNKVPYCPPHQDFSLSTKNISVLRKS